MNSFDDILRFYRQQKELERHAEVIRRASNPLGSTLEGLRPMLEAYERARALYSGPADFLRELQGRAQALQIPNYATELQGWAHLHANLSQATALSGVAQLAGSSTFQMQMALEQIRAQLIRPSWTGLPSTLQSALYSPPLAYSAFARRSIEGVVGTTAERSNAIEASLLLAETQVDDGTRIVASVLDTVDDSAGVDSVAADLGIDIAAPPAEALFTNQQAELIAVESDLSTSAEYEALLVSTPTGQQIQLAHELGEIVVELNQARKLINAEELFPPTTAMLGAMNLLIYTGVRSKVELGTAVDSLYVLLYEGSGEAKRITKLISDDQCEALWTLKQLRNVWLRHDPEHGSEGDQAKKWAKLRQGLAFLGFTGLPTTEAEFQTLYARLLGALVQMMVALKQRVFSANA